MSFHPSLCSKSKSNWKGEDAYRNREGREIDKCNLELYQAVRSEYDVGECGKE